MNDLERDLHELLGRRARDVEPATRAPDAVLRRGRRGQARIVAGGVLAAGLAIAIVVVAAGGPLRDDGVPAGRDDIPAPIPTGTAPRLQTRGGDDGDLVVFGHDLGHDWEIHHDGGVLRFLVDGTEDPGGGFSFSIGSSTGIDVDGGTFLIGVFDRNVTSWRVAV